MRKYQRYLYIGHWLLRDDGIAMTRPLMALGRNNGNTSGTRNVKIWLFTVAFNYGARFYESSVAESKNSIRSRREPGGRRRGSIKISSGEV